MSGSVGDIDMLSCANCGIGEENINKLKKCSACLSVKYCSAACQKAHRPQHKKACKRRAAELHDEKLFKDHPPREECPICLLPLPIQGKNSTFQSCCGKMICNGCDYAIETSEEKDLCAFCRMPPASSDEEQIKQLNKLMDKGNAGAFDMFAWLYYKGRHGMPQNPQKANELWLKAGELGYAAAYFNLGCSYEKGTGVEFDMNKAKHYYELAAMGGDLLARNNLGCLEGTGKAGNEERAFKHYIIAARAGLKLSLDNVKKGFMKGVVTKEEYASTLRCYYDRQAEMKSDARDKAAAYYGC